MSIRLRGLVLAPAILQYPILRALTDVIALGLYQFFPSPTPCNTYEVEHGRMLFG